MFPGIHWLVDGILQGDSATCFHRKGHLPHPPGEHGKANTPPCCLESSGEWKEREDRGYICEKAYSKHLLLLELPRTVTWCIGRPGPTARDKCLFLPLTACSSLGELQTSKMSLLTCAQFSLDGFSQLRCLKTLLPNTPAFHRE